MRRIELTCQICGKSYSVRAKEHDQKTCSRTCRTTWIGKTESAIEQAIEQSLKATDLPFEKQFPFGPFTCDFAIPSHRLAIECDGSYWHSLPEVQKRDRKRDNYFYRHGWKTLRFSEQSIITNIDKCIIQIRNHVLPPEFRV
jgi:very-short-patch-repair endonuclease